MWCVCPTERPLLKKVGNNRFLKTLVELILDKDSEGHATISSHNLFITQK